MASSAQTIPSSHKLSGANGKTKLAIENMTRTRVVLSDQKISILGYYRNIGIAQEAIVSLILGSPPVSLAFFSTEKDFPQESDLIQSKVYGNLRTVASRMKERF